MSYYTDAETRDKIDAVLRRNAAVQASLGKDSTESERHIAKMAWRAMLEEIRELDPEFADRCSTKG
jgi:hypothetical protein